MKCNFRLGLGIINQFNAKQEQKHQWKVLFSLENCFPCNIGDNKVQFLDTENAKFEADKNIM